MRDKGFPVVPLNLKGASHVQLMGSDIQKLKRGIGAGAARLNLAMTMAQSTPQRRVVEELGGLGETTLQMGKLAAGIPEEHCGIFLDEKPEVIGAHYMLPPGKYGGRWKDSFWRPPSCSGRGPEVGDLYFRKEDHREWCRHSLKDVAPDLTVLESPGVVWTTGPRLPPDHKVAAKRAAHQPLGTFTRQLRDDQGGDGLKDHVSQEPFRRRSGWDCHDEKLTVELEKRGACHHRPGDHRAA